MGAGVAIRMAGRLARRERMRRILEGRFRSDATSPAPDEPVDAVHRAVRGLPPAQRAATLARECGGPDDLVRLTALHQSAPFRRA
jgi:DNA-directed RNA polymerase specialized sigma24 family protein